MGSLFLKIYQKTIFKKPRFGHFEPNQRKLDSLRFKDCKIFPIINQSTKNIESPVH